MATCSRGDTGDIALGTVGTTVGLGAAVGTGVGLGVEGMAVGMAVGLGVAVGMAVGARVGLGVAGMAVGAVVGRGVAGMAVGAVVGLGVEGMAVGAGVAVASPPQAMITRVREATTATISRRDHLEGSFRSFIYGSLGFLVALCRTLPGEPIFRYVSYTFSRALAST